MVKIKKFFKKNWILVLILIVAAFLRLFKLGSFPVSLTWDETALGYNAFSLLKTGRDEYGKLLPLVLKSFGDYKPALYSYLAIPSVLVFGLSEFAVRLPSALFGILSVFLVYKFSLLFFKDKTKALFISFALALMPWHINFSRGAWESNVALFFILLGIYCFLKSKEKVKFLYFSVLSFGAAVLTYQGGKMMVPLIILGLLIFFFDNLKKINKKHLLFSALVLFILSLPILSATFFGGGGRLKVMSLFSYHRPQEEIQEIINQDEGNKFIFSLFHNEGLFYTQGILGRFFNHFSGRFLFFEGDWSSQRHGPPYMGMLYYIDILFLILGSVYLIRNKIKGSGFIWWWLIISVLPSALTRDSIQAVRSLNMILPLSILIGLGLYEICSWLRQRKRLLFVLIGGFLLVFYLYCFIYYLDMYYVHYPLKSSEYWQYGHKEVIEEVYKNKDKYSKIVFTQKYGQPYIFWLFYSQYDPSLYQKQALLTENPYGDVGKIERFDNIEFRDIYWPNDRSLKNSLFVGTEEELPLRDISPNQARILNEIIFKNGKIAFRLVETYED